MKKLFLVPLMALMCSVAAWGSEIVVNDFASLKTALSASGTDDVVKLGQDITYGSEVLNIERSLTLDGQGHEIIGSVTCELSISNEKTFVRNTIIAVNRGNVGSNLDIKVKNLYIQHSGESRREICFAIFDGVSKFALDSVKADGRTKSKDMQPLLITGSDATPLQLNISNSQLLTANYPAYILKPITANLSNTTIAGYCGLYFKYQWSSGTTGYGNTVGSRGSVVNADACVFDCPNTAKGESNNFAVFPLEDDGITLNLNNCSMNAENIGADNNGQRLVNLQYDLRANGATGVDVNVNISGDNTHIYNIEAADPNKLIWNGWVVGIGAPSTAEGTSNQTFSDIKVKITGGTLNIDPTKVKWYTVADNIAKATNAEYKAGTYINQSAGSGAITIPATHEVQTVNQGGITLYRVVKKAAEKEPGVMYDLNDDVPTDEDGAGNNPATSFDLSTGTEMKLNQETTKAGYVQISDNGDDATVVKVGKETQDQVLIINNGLDVQGDSKVEVQPGSALVIGEGGIVTEKPENIVIEADENGAASLLLDPAINVNTTPNLTVKMVAKQVGKISTGEYWHRFAMPVEHIDAWEKQGDIPGTTYPTYLYYWDYDNDKWANIGGAGVSAMVPFKGYTLRLQNEAISGAEGSLHDVTYIFKGNLAGNTNNTLNFTRDGFNFFGNSYTGYISLKQLKAQLLGDSKIEATVWVWDAETQRYDDVAMRYADEEEIAPMHTFVMKLNEVGSHSTEINYESAIWGNPRYTSITGVMAPARHEDNGVSSMNVVITAANGQKDIVHFYEDAARSDAFENGYDASKFMNERTINVYSTNNGEDLGTVSSDNLVGKTISLNTNDEIAYTLSFTKVNGLEYALEDMVTGKVIAIEEGTTYEFAAQPNSKIADRFRIVGIHKVPTSVETTEVKSGVKGIYTILGQYVGEDFNTLPAGVYVVDGVKIVK